jgi:hypothetical protein
MRGELFKTSGFISPFFLKVGLPSDLVVLGHKKKESCAYE